MVDFYAMTEERLRQWVNANPWRVNDRDERGHTPLYAAARYEISLPLVLWLLDEKGADVNSSTAEGRTPLHHAASLDILTALLDRGANPIVQAADGSNPLIQQAKYGNVDVMARLLQEPRIRAISNVQDVWGGTALHSACITRWRKDFAVSIIHLLLQAGADPTITNKEGLAPLAFLRQERPTYRTTIALLEEALADIEGTWLIVKARRLIVTATKTIVPSYLQQRMARGQPLPRVALVPLTAEQNDVDEKECRKFRNVPSWDWGGAQGRRHAADIFRVVLEVLMPAWDLLQRGVAGMGPAVQG